MHVRCYCLVISLQDSVSKKTIFTANWYAGITVVIFGRPQLLYAYIRT